MTDREKIEILVNALRICRRRLRFIEWHSCENPERAGYESKMSIDAATKALELCDAGPEPEEKLGDTK